MNLHAAGPAEMPGLWPRVRDRIASCCDRSGGKYEPADILRNLIAGRMDLWLAEDGGAIHAVAISEIVVYPRVRVCKLLACTGEKARRWLDLLAQIEAWARAQGCAVIEPVCRPGWERHLKPMGYRKTHVVLEKTL